MYPKVLVVLAAVCLAVTLLAVTFASHTSKAVLAASTATPAYTRVAICCARGLSRVDLSQFRDRYELFSEGRGMEDHSTFDNVFVNPEAYRSFLNTGTWPDKTVMVIEGREAASKDRSTRAGIFRAAA